MIQKIGIEELRVGMYVVDTHLPWIEAPYLYSREGVIRTASELNRIRTEGYQEIFVDEDRSLWVEAGNEGSGSTAEGLVSLNEELPAASRVYTDTLQFAKKLIHSLRQGGMPSHGESETFVNGVIDSAVRNQDALLTLFKLREYDEYTYTHCVNVSVLAVVMGKYLGLDREQLRILGISGLLHDVGKECIPGAILNKPGKLTPEEFRIIQGHSEEGFRIVQKQKGIHPKILECILQHHEKHNGRGYPSGLSGGEITSLAAVVSISDIYDALTSNRPYKNALAQHQALKIIFGMKGQDLSQDLVERFIRCLGIYPLGSLVRLSNGMYGIVVGENSVNLLLPTVKIVSDEKGRHVRGDVLDLGAEPSLPTGARLEIVSTHDPRELGLDSLKLLSPDT
jgi:putative nucleotidyltransferase with HDIG domain